MEVADAREILRSARVLASLSDAALERLAQAVTWRQAAAGETLVAYLAPTRSVHFLVSGSCSARMMGPNSRAFPLRRLHAGAHFGELAALTGAPRTVEIIAETDVLVAECPAAAFDALMDSEPGLAKAIAHSLARTVISLTDRLFEFAVLEVRYRLQAELLRLARTGEETADGVLITDTPTQEALAAAIGSQREAVNKELQYLESEGLLSRRPDRKIVIRDLAKLRASAQARAGATASQILEWEE